MNKDEEFLKLLLATFKTEAEEHVQAMSSGLQELGATTDRDRRAGIVETVYREAHSLKGASRAVNRADIEQLCQALESVLASWKRGESAPSPEAIAVMLRAVDAAAGVIGSPAPMDAASLTALVQDIAAGGTVRQVAAPAAEAMQLPQTVAVDKTAAAIETVRIPTAKLDGLIREIEEFLPSKMAATKRAEDLREMESILDRWREQWGAAHPRLRDIQFAIDRQAAPSQADVLHLVDFIEWNSHCMKLLEEKLGSLLRASTHDRQEISKRIDELLEGSKRLAMMPCQTIFAALPKIVRDLCRDSGKDAELAVRGGEVEVDKHILEELKDPLVHIIRNCIDHGIEKPEIRAKSGKPARGLITIAISQVEGNKAEIVIRDDGRGIDIGQLKQAAMKEGTLSAQDASHLADDAALRLIFESGISTSSAVTEISGRGLGLAIVREKVEKLGGRIEVRSQAGKGTVLRLVLPLTRATFRGILVQVAGHVFVIPTASMERAMRVARDDVRTIENCETITFAGRPLALVRLSGVLGLEPRAATEQDFLPVIILRHGERHIAFGVDEVLHETEVQIKPLGPPLIRVRNVAAATVIGGGQTVPVLNVADLLESATRHHAAGVRPTTPPIHESRKGSILVVEDSITSRMLLKNILEAAGHRVKTAVDGIDALTTLRTEEFDLVVSDVDMPRLNGLDLTTRIRADKRLTDKPVILVTALASQADRERGVQVGANAYIVKSSFDQSNLLDAVDRLL